jgi:hypothetical protein
MSKIRNNLEGTMKRFGVVALVGVEALSTAMTLAVSAERGGGSPVFGVELPPGYRDWQVASVAHEAGNNNDIRAILGNDIAISAFRNGQRPFPDGAIIVRLAWQYVSSPANNAVFSTPQSFVAGAPTNVQVSVKDSARYAATGGWGYGQFEEGKPNPNEALVNTCFACHNKVVRSDDLVFTKYAQ